MHSDDDVSTRIIRRSVQPQEAEGEDCLVVIHSAAPADFGRRHALKPTLTTIGRSRSNDIAIFSDSISRQHAELERRDGELFVRDLNSTNGTFINNELKRRKEFKLKQGDLLRIGETIFKFLSGVDIESQYHAVIADMALKDGLTDLPNRRKLDLTLAGEIERARRHGRELSILMIDIDHFKRINDQHGHVAGDSVLSQIASLFRQRLRPSDTIGRYGGEEFCAILPETPLARAVIIAETLRALVADEVFVADSRQLQITVSIGAASWTPQALYEDLYREADRRLYQAKRLGRNRVSSE